LGDDKSFPFDILQRPVQAVLLVAKNTEVGGFMGERVCLGGGIASGDADQDHHALTDLGGYYTCNAHMCLRDALNQ